MRTYLACPGAVALAAFLLVVVPAATARGRVLAVDLVAMEFLFEPNKVSVLEPGQIALVIRNVGAIDHNLVIESSAGKTVAEIPTLEPGQRAETLVTLPAGVYTIYCSLPGHRAAGMNGVLRVGSPPLVSSTLKPAAAVPVFATPAVTVAAPAKPARTPKPPESAVRARPLPPAPRGRLAYHVQAGAFRQRQYADQLVRTLRTSGYPATVAPGPLLRVWVGPAMSQEAALRLAAELHAKGFETLLLPAS